MYLAPTHQQAECDTVFKQNQAGLNSEFSFSYASCLTRAKNPICPNIYSLLRREEIDTFFSQGH